MSTSYQPGPNGEQPGYWPPSPPKKSRKLPWILGGLAALIAIGCVMGGVFAIGGAGKAVVDAANSAAATPAPKFVEPGRPPSAGPSADVQAGDLKLSVKTNSKECFGSAGCNIEYQIKLGYDAAKMVPGECDITYQVNGLTDPQIGTLHLHTDGTYEQDSYQSGQTSSSSKKLTAKLVEIDCN